MLHYTAILQQKILYFTAIRFYEIPRIAFKSNKIYFIIFLLVQLSSPVQNEVTGKSFQIIIHVSFHYIWQKIYYLIFNISNHYIYILVFVGMLVSELCLLIYTFFVNCIFFINFILLRVLPLKIFEKVLDRTRYFWNIRK